MATEKEWKPRTKFKSVKWETLRLQRIVICKTGIANVLFSVIIFISVFPPSVFGLSCTQPGKDDLIPWRDRTANFVIDWLIDEVCSSYRECLGHQPNGDVVEDVQLCPLFVQAGDRVFLSPPPPDGQLHLRPVNVSYETWLSCPHRNHHDDQLLYQGNHAEETIEIPQSFLKPGTTYIAQHPNGFLSDCKTVGLRIAITIKPNRCQSNYSNEDCLGRGQCVTTLMEKAYTCKCARYTGPYCEEYDACHSQPCYNNGTCEDVDDVMEGQVGTSFTCNCTEKFTGPECRQVRGVCADGVCNNGTCRQVEESVFECICNPGYQGTFCEMKLELCASAPCRNNGTCQTTPDGDSYVCTCLAGYTGPTCDVYLEQCIPNPCQASSTCVNYGTSFVCLCAPGTTGTYCQHQLTGCDLEPCHNEGTCSEDPNGDIVCNCSLGYTGDRCDDLVTSCGLAPDICQNGGHCVEQLSGPIQCQCSPGWTGPLCDQLDNLCVYEPGPCPNDTVCVDTSTIENPAQYLCVCPQGNKRGACASDVNECEGSPCQNGGTCLNTLGSFACQCIYGFEGFFCERDVDACSLINKCANNSTCMDLPSGIDYQCQCLPGFTGVHCEVDIDECTSGPCLRGAVCTNLPGAYSCACPPGFFGPRCSTDVDFCNIGACANGATCVWLEEAYACVCAVGWTAPNCDVQLNECQDNVCQNGATCQDLVGGYRCVCTAGFTGDLCEQEVNECSSTPCQHGATCEDGTASYTCRCSPGYTGIHCESDIDECASGPCQHGALCINSLNTYFCDCNSQLWGGRNCDVPLSVCSVSPCQHNSTCQVTPAPTNFTCLCQGRWTGVFCEEYMPYCASEICQNGASCKELTEIESFACECLAGYTGMLCELDIDECVSHRCAEGSTCVDVTNGYGCRCPPGVTGTFCEIAINECASMPCKNGALCVDGNNAYECFCVNGFIGSDCSINIDDCLDAACHPDNTAVCVDGVATYICECKSGYTGTLCDQQIDDCVGHRCQNGATCIDGTNWYRCACVPGYTDDFCATDINECASTPCHSDSTCVDDIGAFRCLCPQDGRFLYDELCQTLPHCSKKPCVNSATCIDSEDFSTYSCQCAPGWRGDSCEYEINECAGNDVCKFGTCIDKFNGFECECFSGYTGKFCDQNIDDCITNQCINNATCVDKVNGYDCKCSVGFTGKSCEVEISRCSQSPCQNEAVSCDVIFTDGKEGFSCNCAMGFSGRYCEDNIDDCETESCMNGGSCIDGVNSITCLCIEAFTGDKCQTNIDDCESHNCTHGGTCVDGVGTFTCACPAVYTGPYCEVETDECLSSPCNAGFCKDLFGGYQCFCRNGFTGPRCDEDYDECVSAPCRNGATCHNLIASFRCDCRPGFSGVQCELNVDECVSSPCATGATCVDGDNSFSCVCPPGYTGARCEQDINECLSAPCQNGGICRDHHNAYFCDCPRPFVGPDCANLPCDLDPCGGGNCTNDIDFLPNGFRCTCLTGFTGLTCQSNIDDCRRREDEPPICSGHGLCIDGIASYTCFCNPGWKGFYCDLPIDQCADHGCKNNATCINRNQGYSCACAAGWEGSLCEREADECASRPCASGAACVDLFNDFRCECPAGFTGKTCITNIDECRLPDGENPCLNGATCVDNVNKFTCLCPPFFTGLICELVYDPCDEDNSPCQNEAACETQMDGGYYCSCPQGFSGLHCEIDLNECLSTPCANNATCEDQPNGYLCHCVAGYNGSHCEDNIDDCVGHGCQNGATCVDLINGYLCNCTSGYMGENCTDDIDECVSEPCLNGATCTNRQDGFMCTCRLGWQGVTCELETDECLSMPCENNGLCEDRTADFMCYCRLGFTGKTCNINIDDCSPGICNQGTCVDGINTFTCTCDPGFTGSTCQTEVNECSSQPCINNGTCHDTVNGYNCTCLEGYTGAHCEVDMNVCSVGICLNGGSCVDGPGNTFKCSCLAGFTGTFCEVDLDECASSPCHNNATCHNVRNGFVCNCSSGWQGTLCDEDIDDCASEPCLNNGLCRHFPPGLGYECLCIPGFGGAQCQINYDDCLPEPRCLNNATCVDGINTFTCLCPEGATGSLCETLLPTTMPPTTEPASTDSVISPTPSMSSSTTSESMSSTATPPLPTLSSTASVSTTVSPSTLPPTDSVQTSSIQPTTTIVPTSTQSIVETSTLTSTGAVSSTLSSLEVSSLVQETFISEALSTSMVLETSKYDLFSTLVMEPSFDYYSTFFIDASSLDFLSSSLVYSSEIYSSYIPSDAPSETFYIFESSVIDVSSVTSIQEIDTASISILQSPIDSGTISISTPVDIATEIFPPYSTLSSFMELESSLDSSLSSIIQELSTHIEMSTSDKQSTVFLESTRNLYPSSIYSEILASVSSSFEESSNLVETGVVVSSTSTSSESVNVPLTSDIEPSSVLPETEMLSTMYSTLILEPEVSSPSSSLVSTLEMWPSDTEKSSLWSSTEALSSISDIYETEIPMQTTITDLSSFADSTITTPSFSDTVSIYPTSTLPPSFSTQSGSTAPLLTHISSMLSFQYSSMSLSNVLDSSFTSFDVHSIISPSMSDSMPMYSEYMSESEYMYSTNIVDSKVVPQSSMSESMYMSILTSMVDVASTLSFTDIQPTMSMRDSSYFVEEFASVPPASSTFEGKSSTPDYYSSNNFEPLESASSFSMPSEPSFGLSSSEQIIGTILQTTSITSDVLSSSLQSYLGSSDGSEKTSILVTDNMASSTVDISQDLGTSSLFAYSSLISQVSSSQYDEYTTLTSLPEYSSQVHEIDVSSIISINSQSAIEMSSAELSSDPPTMVSSSVSSFHSQVTTSTPSSGDYLYSTIEPTQEYTSTVLPSNEYSIVFDSNILESSMSIDFPEMSSMFSRIETTPLLTQTFSSLLSSNATNDIELPEASNTNTVLFSMTANTSEFSTSLMTPSAASTTLQQTSFISSSFKEYSTVGGTDSSLHVSNQYFTIFPTDSVLSSISDLYTKLDKSYISEMHSMYSSYYSEPLFTNIDSDYSYGHSTKLPDLGTELVFFSTDFLDHSNVLTTPSYVYPSTLTPDYVESLAPLSTSFPSSEIFETKTPDYPMFSFEQPSSLPFSGMPDSLAPFSTSFPSSEIFITESLDYPMFSSEQFSSLPISGMPDSTSRLYSYFSDSSLLLSSLYKPTNMSSSFMDSEVSTSSLFTPTIVTDSEVATSFIQTSDVMYTPSIDIFPTTSYAIYSSQTPVTESVDHSSMILPSQSSEDLVMSISELPPFSSGEIYISRSEVLSRFVTSLDVAPTETLSIEMDSSVTLMQSSRSFVFSSLSMDLLSSEMYSDASNSIDMQTSGNMPSTTLLSSETPSTLPSWEYPESSMSDTDGFLASMTASFSYTESLEPPKPSEAYTESFIQTSSLIYTDSFAPEPSMTYSDNYITSSPNMPGISLSEVRSGLYTESFFPSSDPASMMLTESLLPTYTSSLYPASLQPSDLSSESVDPSPMSSMHESLHPSVTSIITHTESIQPSYPSSTMYTNSMKLSNESSFVYPETVQSTDDSSMLYTEVLQPSDISSVLYTETFLSSNTYSYIIDTPAMTHISSIMASETSNMADIDSVTPSLTNGLVETAFLQSSSVWYSSILESDIIQPTSVITTVMPSSSVIITTTPTVTEAPASCADDPCMHNGTCVDQVQDDAETSYKCMCTFKYTGNRCEIEIELPRMQMSGQSYVRFPAPEMLSINNFSLSLSTLQENGVVFYAAVDYTSSRVQHYIRLFIEQGVLKYQFSCIMDSFELDSTVKVNTGDVVNISVIQTADCRAALNVITQTEERSISLGMSFVFERFRLTKLADIFVGGIPGNIEYVNKDKIPNLIGCVEDIKWNDEPIRLVDAVDAVNVVACGAVQTTPPPPTPSPHPTCGDIVCENGGTCSNVQTPQGHITYRCDCPLHFAGTKCEQEIAVYFPHFMGESFLEHEPISFSPEGVLDLYLTFKTNVTEGTLLYADSEAGEYVDLFLVGGELRLMMSCGPSSVMYIDSQVAVNTEELIAVDIRFSVKTVKASCELSLQVDNQLPLLTSLTPAVPPPTTPYTLGPLYLGGLPPGQRTLSTRQHSGFVGCIRHLQVSGAERLVFQDAVSGRNIDADCQVPVCTYHPCVNNGTCHLDGSGGWYCECRSPFTGALCERSLCDHQPCEHGATCIERDGGTAYVCLCPYGRHGVNCSEAISIDTPLFAGDQFGYASFMAYEPMMNVNFEFDIRFKFSISEEKKADVLKSSLLIFSGEKSGVPGRGSDYLTVGIDNGHVVFRFDLGSGMADIRTPQPINDSLTFHTVQLGRKEKSGWLQVDDQLNVTGESKFTLIGLNIKSELYVGGHDDLTNTRQLLPDGAQFDRGFAGCIYELAVRGGRYGRWSSAGAVITGRSVGACGASECDLNACSNNAQCVDHGASFSCTCPPSFAGLLCTDTVTPCHSEDTHECADNALCVPGPESQTYSCDCTLGTAGQHCKEVISLGDVRFVGERSYMAFNPPRNVRFAVDAEIQFKPEVETGLLLYVAEHLSERTSDFLAVELYQGHVYLRYNTGTDLPTVVKSNNTVNASQDVWHRLLIGRNSSHGYVNLDGQEVTREAQPGMVSLDVTTQLYLGGLADLSALSPLAVENEPITFEGCVRLLMVNGQLYPLTKEGALEGRNVVSCDSSACGFSSCENGGTCLGVNEVGRVICQCTKDYYGQTCNIPRLCFNNRCRSGSTCIANVAAQNYSCVCPLGREGVFCERDIAFSSAEFRGDGYIFYNDTNYETSDKTITYVAFDFSTSINNGIIVWNGEVFSDRDDFLGVGISRGHLKLVINLGYWSRAEIITQQVVNDSVWHRVVVRRTERDLRLRLDITEYTATINGDFIGLDTMGHYYIGGFGRDHTVFEQTNGHFDTSFVGAVRDFRIRDATPGVDLMSANGGVNVLNGDHLN